MQHARSALARAFDSENRKFGSIQMPRLRGDKRLASGVELPVMDVSGAGIRVQSLPHARKDVHLDVVHGEERRVQ